VIYSFSRHGDIAIVADEVGIEIGIVGAHRLRVCYQPIFARFGACLSAVAVHGFAMPFQHGQAVPHQAFHDAVAPRERFAVTALAAALSLRNLPHAGTAGSRLALRADLQSAVTAGRVRAAVRLLAAEIARNGLEPRAVSVELTGLAKADRGAAMGAFAALQDRGIAIAILEQGNGPALGLLPDPLPADLVRIDGGWFRAVARQAQTARLFVALVRAYRSSGAQVLVDGIATETALRVALDSEAELFSGPLLAPPALAGEVFPDAPLPIEGLFAERRVIQLFR
jgi:EAL domain-containing protein (putative c-di-GMP-specific phosphodiesterase class I)